MALGIGWCGLRTRCTRCASRVANRVSERSQVAFITATVLLWCLKVIGWHFEVSKNVIPSMLLKATIMLRVVSERGFLRTPRSTSDFAVAVVLRAVRMHELASWLFFVFGFKLVQNSCICTSFNDDKKIFNNQDMSSWDFTSLDSNHAHLILRGLGRSVVVSQSRQNNVQVLLQSSVRRNPWASDWSVGARHEDQCQRRY